MPIKRVKPKQMKNTTKTKTKCLLDSVYNRIGANLQTAQKNKKNTSVLTTLQTNIQ